MCSIVLIFTMHCFTLTRGQVKFIFFFSFLKNLETETEKSTKREKELEDVCKEQAIRIEQLTQLVGRI